MDNKVVRALARSDEYQILYSRSKEIGSLQLFNNCSDYTALQIGFLYWLEIYNGLYLDLGLKKDYISIEVIDDDIRTEAYLLWRREAQNKETNIKENTNKVTSSSGIPSVLFKRK